MKKIKAEVFAHFSTYVVVGFLLGLGFSLAYAFIVLFLLFSNLFLEWFM